MVYAHGDLSLEGLPGRFGVSRPDPAAPAGDAQIASAMQAPGPDIGKGRERSLIIQLMPFYAFVEIEPIAFVGPEGICACLHQCDMLLPVVLNMSRIQHFARCGRDGSMQIG